MTQWISSKNGICGSMISYMLPDLDTRNLIPGSLFGIHQHVWSSETSKGRFYNGPLSMKMFIFT